LKARKCRLHIKDIKIKVILYNLSRLMNSYNVLIIIGIFNRAGKAIVLSHLLQIKE